MEVRILKGPGRIPRDDKLYKYFTIEGWFNYPDLSLYYGPSNITHIIQFVERVEAFKAQSPDKTVCLIIKINSDQALNSVLCVSAFLVLMKEVHPKLAVLAINPVLKELQTLHYKTEGEEISDDIPITILDCLQGLKVFMSLNLLDLEHLDVDE